MAGLLDFLSQGDNPLGLALLAAGGPTTDPKASGFGARLGGAVQSAMAQKADQENQVLRRSLLLSQVAENETQNKVKLAGLQRQAAQDAYYMGGAATAPVAGSAGGPAPAAGAAVPGAAMGAAPGTAPPSEGKFAEWSRQFNIPKDALVADYFSNGGKSIADMLFKAGRPDMKVQDGYLYDANRPRGEGFLPGLTTSADGTSTLRLPDSAAPGGVRIQAPEGALGAAAAYGTQKALIGAQFSPGRPGIAEGGRMVGQSQAQEIGLPPPALLGRAGPTNMGERSMAAAVSEPMGFDAAAARRELTATENDLKTKNLDPASRQALQAHAEDLRASLKSAGKPLIGQTSQVAAGGVDFSPAEKNAQAADLKLAEGRAAQQLEREKSSATTGRQFSQMSEAANMAEQLLKENPTGSGLGSMADKVGNFVGQPIKGADKAAQLKALGGWLVANVPRMEGPQSDRDVANYNTMAGQVGDETLPPSTRLAALRTVRELQQKYAAINGGEAPPGVSASAPNTKPSGMVIPQGWSVKVR